MTGNERAIAVVGAGPIGVVAAAHIVARSGQPVVMECGDALGASVREWSHIKLFSPWKWIIDPVSRWFLLNARHRLPDPEVTPTGAELLSEFIEPLGRAISIDRYLLLRHDVISISRKGADEPFQVKARTPQGTVTVYARAVIDASGTWRTPNPLGAGGLPAIGEAENSGAICYGIPDILGRDRDRYACRHVAVVGSGHSAANLLIDLARLDASTSRTTWVLRNTFDPKLYGRGDADVLSARAQLGLRVRTLVEAGVVRMQDAFPISAVRRAEDGVVLETADGRHAGPFDRVIAATGFRPDHSFTADLRVQYDLRLGAPVRLAPQIDPVTHPSGTDFLHGYAHLAHTEKDFFTVGMKSYGRAPSFDLLTGCEQVRSVVALLMGDAAAADRIEATYLVQAPLQLSQ